MPASRADSNSEVQVHDSMQRHMLMHVLTSTQNQKHGDDVSAV